MHLPMADGTYLTKETCKMSIIPLKKIYTTLLIRTTKKINGLTEQVITHQNGRSLGYTSTTKY